ncbi:MAG: hypothetical protein AYK23_04010 [Candidatus Proteinoplasmatales archaeon SG8-5]|nr:MAG: hypothetical protein AYK23_04010 [Candidatus Proteinoplasmatales archaeon SG8-5]
MEDFAYQQLIGRARELEQLRDKLNDAVTGKGGTVLISGEAGIGKTRLIEEFKSIIPDKESLILSGAAAMDTLQPFLIFSDCLEERIDKPLFLDQEYVSFTEIFAVDREGKLMAKASLDGEEGMDADIFAGMLSAVQDFVRDSFDSSGDGKAGLGRLEYGDMKILMEHGPHLFLTAVFRGAEHPDMRKMVKETVRAIEEKDKGVLEPGSADVDDTAAIRDAISQLFDARFLVRRDMEGVKLEEERLRIANQVLELVVGITREKPLVLILEDLHWADASSLFVLNFLARNVRKEKILLVCTLRPKESDILQEAIERMDEEGVSTEVILGQMGRDDVSSLVNGMFVNNEFPQAFIGQLAEQCEGNPFFIIEMLRHMHDEEIIVKADGGYQLVSEDYTIPATVEDVVHRRLGTLTPDVMAMAEYSSCIGRVFASEVALSIDSLKDPSAALGELQGTGIVVANNGNSEFSHAIFQEVIYGGIGERWRSAHHRNLGEYYESTYANRLDEVLFDLAKHFSLSNEHQKAYDYCCQAGDMAENTFATEQAIDFFDKALERLPNLKLEDRAEREAELFERLGDLHTLIGDFEPGIEEYQKAMDKQSDKRKKADVQRKLAIIYEKKGDYEKNLEECNRALELLEGDETIVKSRILSTQGFAYMRQGDFQNSEEVLRESLRIAESFDDKTEIAMANHSLGTMLWHRGQMDDAFVHLEKAVELREELNDKIGLSRSLNNIGLISFNTGKIDKALENWNKSMELFRITGDIANMAVSIGNIGTIYLVVSNFDEALKYYHESLEIREKIGDKRGTAVGTCNIGAIYHLRGNLDEAEVYVKRSLDIYRQVGDKPGMSGALNNMASIYSLKGDVDQALEYFEQGLATALEIGEKRPAIHNYLGVVESHLRKGDVELARSNAEKALEMSDDLKSKAEEAISNKAMGLVLREREEWDEALERFNHARGISEASGDRHEIAHLDLEEGRLWKAKGDGPKARERFEAALEYFKGLGNKVMMDMLEEELKGT